MRCNENHAPLENNFILILDKHALKETKILRGYQKSHFDKNLRKQIMARSRLERKANKSKILVTFSSLSDNETWWQI